MKERLLREPKLTLEKALDVCRAAETSRDHIRQMTTAPEAAIGRLGLRHNGNLQPRGKTPSLHTQPKQINDRPSSQRITNCHFCGRDHNRQECPAYGKSCSTCGGKNHFAIVCKGGGFRTRATAGRPAAVSHRQATPTRQHTGSHNNNNNMSNSKARGFDTHRHKNVSTVQQFNGKEDNKRHESDDDLLFIGKLFNEVNSEDKWHEKLLLNKFEINFKLDTGADANIMPTHLYQQFTTHFKTLSLLKTTQCLTAFGGTKVKPNGKFIISTYCPLTKTTHNVKYYVTDTSDEPILGKHACEAFNLVYRNTDTETGTTYVHTNCKSDNPLTEEVLVQQYSDDFTGLGMYEEKY